MKRTNEIRFSKRFEFIKKHKNLFERYVKINGYPQSSNLIVKKIASFARKEIGYSTKTASCDIAWTLGRLYLEVIKLIII